MITGTPILDHVKSLEFDLYVDESGDFVSRNKDWLIGGYLIPHREDAPALAENWWRKVLDAVDARWPGKRREHYVLAHCTDTANEMFYGEMPRSQVQPMVLEMLVRFIREAKGFPVIFLCPAGSCVENGEFNFACCMAHGYSLLQSHLQRMYPGTIVRIIPHISHRIETHGTELKHDGTDKGILEAYIAHVRSTAFSWCDSSHLKNTLERAQLLTTTTPPCITHRGDLKTDSAADNSSNNLFNVICDYICNSYYSLDKNNYAETLKDAAVISIYRDGLHAPQVVMNTASSELPKPAEKQIPSCLQLLLKRDGAFQFNDFEPDTQRALINQLYEELGEFVKRQEQMETTDNNLKTLLKTADSLSNESIRSELIANLLLFRIAIANHHGRIEQTDELYIDFRAALDKIDDSAVRNELAAMYYNRKIVLSTDQFDYSGAEDMFAMMQRYWENSEITITPEYGRTIGSILQNSCHRMRLSGSYTEKSAIYMEAFGRARLAKLYMSTPYDLSRHEQTMSHVESEVGNFDDAFRHLLCAARLIGGEEWEDRHAEALAETDGNVTRARCLAILSVVGRTDPKTKKPVVAEPFMLFHYLRLADEMQIAGKSEAKMMFDTLRENGKGVLLPNSYAVIRSTHARTQILWKLGSLAARLGMPDEGGKLMRDAFKLLTATKSSVFSAIAIAIYAEYIALKLSGADERLKDLRAEYARFTNDKPLFMRDPFAACEVDAPLKGGEFSTKDMMKISRTIAY